MEMVRNKNFLVRELVIRLGEVFKEVGVVGGVKVEVGCVGVAGLRPC